MANELVLEDGVWKFREATTSSGGSGEVLLVPRYGLAADFSTFNTSSFIDTNNIQTSRTNEIYELEEIN